MLLKTTKYINLLVAVLIAIDLVGAAFTALPVHHVANLSYHSKGASAAAGLAYILFEKKAEEETEKVEGGERAKCMGAELVDFSQIAILLSEIHTPRAHLTPYQHNFSIRPSLFTLHCVFLI